MKPTTLVLSLTAAAFALAPVSAHGQTFTDPNFANEVVSYGGIGTSYGPGDGPYYSDPTAALGEPTTLFSDGTDTYHRSMVNPAYQADPSLPPLLVDLTSPSSFLTVKFDTPIVHDSSHWYGDDLIVFGNQGFVGGPGFVGPNTDMTQYFVGDGTTYSTLPTVSVSQDGTNFVTLTSPVDTAGNTLYPENPYTWDTQTQSWGGLEDFTKPVDPSLTEADFAGKSVADAINLYNGSAGGTAFSLAGTGLSSIQYIRFSGVGAVDAVSRISDNPADAPAVPEAGSVWLALLALPLALVARRRAQA